MEGREIPPGVSLHNALRAAWIDSCETGQEIRFDFNGNQYHTLATESWEEAKARAAETLGAPILTNEEMAEEARQNLENMQEESEKAIAEAGVPTEQEMRDTKVPWIKDKDELIKYIDALVDRPHDYGTCVYAMSLAAVAAFRYVAGSLGVTGFQASCADLDILRRTRQMEHGFAIVDYSKVLYPQYWTKTNSPIFESMLEEEENRAKFAKEAQKRLKEYKEKELHDEVRAHWEWLANLD